MSITRISASAQRAADLHPRYPIVWRPLRWTEPAETLSAIRFWLAQAFDADDPESRKAAYEVANELRQEARLAWRDLLHNEEAA